MPSLAHSFLPCSMRLAPPGLITPVCLAAAMLAGCTTTHQFSVDAIRRDATSEPPIRAAYRLVLSPAVAADPEAAALTDPVQQDVITALSAHGMFAAPAGVIPQLEVEVDFGLEGPVRQQRTHTEPVYAIAPRASGRAGANDRGCGLPRRIGERTVTRTVVVYRKFLRLTARVIEAGREERAPVWSVVVTSESESADLQQEMPLLVAAAMDHVDRSTATGFAVELSDRDPRVAFVRRGI